jgi:UrcA family protein
MSNSTFAYWRPTLLLVGCLTSMAVAPRAGAEPQPVPTRAVSYADLNLTTPADMRTLRTRLATAVRTVCAAENRSLVEQARERACVADTWTTTEPDMQAAISAAREHLQAHVTTPRSRAR